MNSADHTRWSDDLAAYLLGALEPSEAQDFERHLEGCERCRGELRWLEPAVHALPEAAARREPPPQLREALMAEVREQAPRRPAKAREARRGWFLRPAVGLAVLALLVAGVVGYEVGRDDDGAGGADTIVREEAGITAKMVQEGDGGRLELAGVEQLPPGRVLEAWVEREGEVEAVPALFVPDRNGQAETTIADMSGVETVMVTEEPRGGSETPTGDPILAMSVPQ